MTPTVLLGISGGIAAYKTPALARLLIKKGINVNVVCTKAALNFVAPLALATVTGNPVFHDMWAEPTNPSVEHIELADRANIVVVAPATANIIGKLAAGIADDMLTTVILAARCPVVLCPSMNVNMYNNPAVQRNLRILKEFGYRILDPDAGFLACGWEGQGRMPEPEVISEHIIALLGPKDLQGINVLISAGPTEEPLDSVRFITNRSSGKMGVAIASRAHVRGAKVTLVAGPLKVMPPSGIRLIPVKTALEMRDRIMDFFQDMDITIKAAAVADFRPDQVFSGKLKKNHMEPEIKLVKNPDILTELGQLKSTKQVLVGFAAEIQDLVDNARQKVESKKVDMLVLNDVSRVDAGFDADTNVVRFLYPSREDEQMDIMSKEGVADLILDRAVAILKSKKSQEILTA